MDCSNNATENVFDVSILNAIQIWTILNMTESAYKKKHCQPCLIDAADKKIEIGDGVENSINK